MPLPMESKNLVRIWWDPITLCYYSDSNLLVYGGPYYIREGMFQFPWIPHYGSLPGENDVVYNLKEEIIKEKEEKDTC